MRQVSPANNPWEYFQTARISETLRFKLEMRRMEIQKEVVDKAQETEVREAKERTETEERR